MGNIHDFVPGTAYVKIPVKCLRYGEEWERFTW